MERLLSSFVVRGLIASAIALAPSGALGDDDLKTSGAFGFPQADALVLCDTEDLRVSAWNDDAYLFVQAVVWKDDNSEAGQTDDGRAIGDWSNLMIDADADGAVTPGLDRDYSLNPWPTMPGLH